jgi:DNA-binding beta-propeller fold protein YncE
VAFDADAGRVYVALTRRAENQLQRINALAVIERERNNSFTVSRRIDFPDAAFDAETGVVFVADAGSPAAQPGLFVIDRDSLQVVDKLRMPGPIARVHTHGPSGTVITTGPTDVLIADAQRMELVTRRSIGTFPLGLAFEPSGAWIVGDARSGMLHRIASIPLAATPWR